MTRPTAGPHHRFILVLSLSLHLSFCAPLPLPRRQTRTGGTRRSRRPLCPAGRRTLADGEDARVVLVDHSPHQVAACSSDGSPAAVCLSCEGGGGLSPDVSAAGGSAIAAVDGCHRVAGLNSSAHHQLVSSATGPTKHVAPPTGKGMSSSSSAA